MILHKRWGDILRLGNFLFKYASLTGFSKKYNTELYLPEHYMFYYFTHKPTVDYGINYDIEIREQNHYYDPNFYNQFDYKNQIINFSLNSFLQSPKYWLDFEEDVIEIFKFKSEHIENVKNKYSGAFNKETIGISIRRGDFINHSVFYQVPIEFYLYSLQKYFDYDKYNLILFCDDYNWIRNTFKQNTNVFFADGDFVNQNYSNNPMEQLILGSLCDNFIISNSTFSWWLGYLGVNCRNKNGKVIHCGENLNLQVVPNSNPNDYYCETWVNSTFRDNDLNLNNIKEKLIK